MSLTLRRRSLGKGKDTKNRQRTDKEGAGTGRGSRVRNSATQVVASVHHLTGNGAEYKEVFT